MKNLLFAAVFVVTFGIIESATAQTFPTRNITILVPYAPGAAADATARIVGEHMAATLGRNVLIENVTRGSGLIATTRVARAAPDGHTLLLHQQALAANVSLFPKAPFDLERDLVPVGLVNTTPMIIVGRRMLAANSAGELAVWMKQAGQQVKFTHGGVGSLNHLCAVLFAQAVGVEVDMIPYRGGAPAVADVLAGHADLFCGSATLVSEQIIARTIKGYGISARERLASLPDVPTLAEQGFTSIDIELWHAMFVPSATPRAIIDRLNQALRAALDDPKVIKSFAVNEATVFPSAQQSPEAAAALVHTEIIRWGEIIRANKIEAAHQ
jgi:tripartite-type tricarboxylate transporter receptor subunit TctC